MSRPAQGFVLAAAVAGLLAVVFAWPGGAASDPPRNCQSIGLPVTGPGGSTAGCIPVSPKTTTPAPRPPPPSPPPPPPPGPPPPVANPPPAVAPLVSPPVAAVVPGIPPATTSPTSRPATPPPTTAATAMPIARPAPPVSIAAEIAKQRRWGLALLVLLIAAGAAGARMRATRR